MGSPGHLADHPSWPTASAKDPENHPGVRFCAEMSNAQMASLPDLDLLSNSFMNWDAV